MHLWLAVLSFYSSLLLLGFSRYCPLCSLSKAKMNSAYWGISPALHGEGSSPTAVCSCLARFTVGTNIIICEHLCRSMDSTAKTIKKKREKWLTPVPRGIKEEEEGDRKEKWIPQPHLPEGTEVMLVREWNKMDFSEGGWAGVVSVWLF